jgi:hypothetical protein
MGPGETRSRLRCARRFECTVEFEEEVDTLESKLVEGRLAFFENGEAKDLGGSSYLPCGEPPIMHRGRWRMTASGVTVTGSKTRLDITSGIRRDDRPWASSRRRS